MPRHVSSRLDRERTHKARCQAGAPLMVLQKASISAISLMISYRRRSAFHDHWPACGAQRSTRPVCRAQGGCDLNPKLATSLREMPVNAPAAVRVPAQSDHSQTFLSSHQRAPCSSVRSHSSTRLIQLHLPPCRGQREGLDHVADGELIDRLEQDDQVRLVDHELRIFNI
jgi:hypothetical protein